jgi:hypothetical protein
VKTAKILTALLTGAPSVVMASTLNLAIFKSPNCGCCVKWIQQFPDSFNFQSFHQYSMSSVKNELGVPHDARSCHTAATKDGIFFEGHVPTKLMKEYVNGKKRDSGIGLAVPGMPIGSPGMEMGERFEPYVVYEILSNGEKEVYATVNSKTQQESLRL